MPYSTGIRHETFCRPVRTGNPRPRHQQRRRGQPHLSRHRGGVARGISDLRRDVRPHGGRGTPASRPIARPLSQEIRRLCSACPPAGRERLCAASPGLAGAAARARSGAQIRRDRRIRERPFLPQGRRADQRPRGARFADAARGSRGRTREARGSAGRPHPYARGARQGGRDRTADTSSRGSRA